MEYIVYADFIGQHEMVINAKNEQEAEEKAYDLLDELMTSNLDELDIQNLTIEEKDPKYKNFHVDYYPEVNVEFDIQAKNKTQAIPKINSIIRSVNEYLSKGDFINIDTYTNCWDYKVIEGNKID